LVHAANDSTACCLWRSDRRVIAPQFVRDRLRIRDVRLYVKDLLLEYHRLQQFEPRVSPRARCMDWARMLQEFEWPHYKEVGCHGICDGQICFGVAGMLAPGLCGTEHGKHQLPIEYLSC
jgi:hypothetical protein